ncbi:response regulator [archaeon]|nr:MAG: response regulator [archaeon]
MTTYWLVGATLKNEKSNAGAIARAEMMVQEVLDASYEDEGRPIGGESQSSHSNSRRNGTIEHTHSMESIEMKDQTKMGGRGESEDAFSDIPLIEESQDSLSALSPSVSLHNKTNSSSSHSSSSSSNIKARHSIRYNIQHRLSDPGQIHDSTGAKILVVEDSTSQRKLLVNRLQQADSTWDITSSISGEDALQKLKVSMN